MTTEHALGDEVQVETPHGWKAGKIAAIHTNYAWSDETRYEIHGTELLTITSARMIRKAAE